MDGVNMAMPPPLDPSDPFFQKKCGRPIDPNRARQGSTFALNPVPLRPGTIASLQLYGAEFTVTPSLVGSNRLIMLGHSGFD